MGVSGQIMTQPDGINIQKRSVGNRIRTHAQTLPFPVFLTPITLPFSISFTWGNGGQRKGLSSMMGGNMGGEGQRKGLSSMEGGNRGGDKGGDRESRRGDGG